MIRSHCRTWLPALSLLLLSGAVLAQGRSRGHDFGATPHRLLPDPAAPPGQLKVEVVDAEDHPLSGQAVQLYRQKQSIAEGRLEAQTELATDSNGSVLFSDLPTDSAETYRLGLVYQGAELGFAPFRLEQDQGMSARFKVFPVVTQAEQAQLGLKGFLVLSPRDEDFSATLVYRIFNLGRTTWLAQGQQLPLPQNAKAITLPAPEGPVHLALRGQELQLLGAFPPGQTDLSVEFQIPRQGTETQSLSFKLPPRVAEFRILLEDGPRLKLKAEGFEPARQAQGPDGRPMLVTGRALRPAEPPLSEIELSIGGLPEAGPERLLVSLAAAFLAVGGLVFALRGKRQAETERLASAAQARRLLLDELLLLEQAHRTEKIGPRTYQETRETLLSALSRVLSLGQGPKPSRGPARSKN